MARTRNWAGLSQGQRSRYERYGRKQGWSETQTEAYYSSGGSLTAARGHVPPSGLSEYRMRKLTQAAKGLTFGEKQADGTIVPKTPGQVIRSALANGLTATEISALIRQRQGDTSAYKGAKAPGPGRGHYIARNPKATGPSVSLYWYH